MQAWRRQTRPHEARRQLLVLAPCELSGRSWQPKRVHASTTIAVHASGTHPPAGTQCPAGAPQKSPSSSRTSAQRCARWAPAVVEPDACHSHSIAASRGHGWWWQRRQAAAAPQRRRVGHRQRQHRTSALMFHVSSLILLAEPPARGHGSEAAKKLLAAHGGLLAPPGRLTDCCCTHRVL